jgi:superfamily II DNA or RNA helicase
MSDKFVPRPFQGQVIQAVMEGTSAGRRVTVVNASPGAGKTLAWQSVATEMLRAGLIDRVFVLAPRVALVAQAELSWKRDEHLFNQPRMGKVRQVNNKVPLPYRHESPRGIALSYQSLIAAPVNYLGWGQENQGKFLLVADEAQFLGAQDEGREGTQAGAVVEKLAGFSAHTLLLTGTPYRSDGGKLILAAYDNNGHLVSHASAYYSDGVREGYLRKFVATNRDADVERRNGENEITKTALSDNGDQLSEILRIPEVWQPIVDDHVKDVRDLLMIDPEYRGLISCMKMSDAKAVARYLKAAHDGLKVMTSVSEDGPEAEKMLRLFREPKSKGGGDILVTVRKAFIGYDCPQISAVCILTNYRDFGHLEQLVGRGLREWSGTSDKSQACRVTAPHDPDMQKFLDHMQRGSDQGIKEKQARSGGTDGPSAPLVTVEDAYATDAHTVGYEGKLSPAMHLELSALKDSLGLNLDLMTIHKIRTAPTNIVASTRHGGREERTDLEQITELNGKTSKAIKSLVAKAGIYPSHPQFQQTIAHATRKVNREAGYTANDCTEAAHAEARWAAVAKLTQEGL